MIHRLQGGHGRNEMSVEESVSSYRLGKMPGRRCRWRRVCRAIDLGKLIRSLHCDYFRIGVAGHPEGHPSSPKCDGSTTSLEMQHLKDKLDAGADFSSPNSFMMWISRCRKIGITCPTIPGIMPIQSYSSLLQMTSFCNIEYYQSLAG